MNNNNNIEQLDLLTLFTSFISIMNFVENKKQTSNDELMSEMKLDIKSQLSKIIKQNEEIIDLLSK